MKKNLLNRYTLPLLALLFAMAVILYDRLTLVRKLYVIHDDEVVMEMASDSIPGIISVEDPVWGMTNISDKEFTMEFYNYIRTLPEMEGYPKENKEEKLSGTIYFVSGKPISFEIGECITLDGIVYGDDTSAFHLKSYRNLMKTYFYSLDNLINVIDANSRIKVRTGTFSRTLAMDEKQKWREILKSGTVVGKEGLTGEKIKERGEVVLQTEFFVDETGTTPEIYMIAYKSGLCMIYDSYGNQSGSIMQIYVDISKLVEGEGNIEP